MACDKRNYLLYKKKVSTDRERLFDIIIQEQSHTRNEIKALRESINEYHNDMKWMTRIGHTVTALVSVSIMKLLDWLHFFQK